MTLMIGLLGAVTRAAAPNPAVVTLSGDRQVLRLYGARGQRPAIVSSGDGGWVHLAPHVAESLAASGYFVVGFDVKAYLSGFTSRQGAVHTGQVPADYERLIDFAQRGSSIKPILVGVSEGAGLSVLAATGAHVKSAIGGVLALGLPDTNELGWRWQDAVIYLTHGIPHEPTFSTASIAAQVSPVPLAVIHSTADEYVPMREVQHVVDLAGEPKRLWLVRASDHRFSHSLAELDRRVLEAIDWIDGLQTGH